MIWLQASEKSISMWVLCTLWTSLKEKAYKYITSRGLLNNAQSKCTQGIYGCKLGVLKTKSLDKVSSLHINQLLCFVVGQRSKFFCSDLPKCKSIMYTKSTIIKPPRPSCKWLFNSKYFNKRMLKVYFIIYPLLLPKVYICNYEDLPYSRLKVKIQWFKIEFHIL